MQGDGMKIFYVRRISDKILLRKHNQPLETNEEIWGYPNEIYDITHECGLYKYIANDNGTLTEINIEDEDEYKKWAFSSNILENIKEDYIYAWGAYGGLGTLNATARTFFNDSESQNVEEYNYELQTHANSIDFVNSSNIEYYDLKISVVQKGVVAVINESQNVVIETHYLDCPFEKFYLNLMTVLFEYGYQPSDFVIKYKREGNAWTTATFRGKKPYSVASLIEDSETTKKIKIRLEVSAGNNLMGKKACLFAFSLVGV